MRRSSFAAGTLALLPWLGVLVFALWAASPILTTPGEVFAGRLSTDNVVTPWFYDMTARALREGHNTEWLWGLRHPNPMPRAVEFPSNWDALLVAPLMNAVAWPDNWGLVQAAALLVNGFGAALLARGLGARGPGILVAGVLGVLCRPVWKDLIMARMNAAFPGLPLGALGAWLWTLRDRGSSALFPALLAVLFGVVGGLVYPPYMAILAPFGMIFGLGLWLDAPWTTRARAMGVVVLVAAISLPELQAIAAAGLKSDVPCHSIACPKSVNAVTWDRIFIWTPDWKNGLSAAGSAGASLLLWPLALVARTRRSTLSASLLVLGLLFFALGSCPAWSPNNPVDLAALPFGWNLWVGYIACKLQPLHDYNRLLTIGVCVAGAMGGMGVDHLWSDSGRRRWGRLRRAILCVGFLAVLGQAQWVVLSESLSPTKWHEASPPTTARHIARLEPEERGLVLELPFDRAAQFLSVLAEPSVPRANPLRPQDPPPESNQAWIWAYAVGNGAELPTEPSARELHAAGLRWVYFDENRCANAARNACAPDTIASLQRVLGRPGRFEGLLVWQVAGPDAELDPPG